ncbi:hypothetical protein LCGC14_0938260 [marine sediment metagenome]|uniref:Uncharacterized protein n=1 Tax=marine sediment metagenome TaxID=412755 RepID=A0A0F9NKZ7_9ZZZZ
MSGGYHKVEWYQCDNCNYSTNDIDRICVHVCQKKKPEVFIERVALCTIEGIRAICGTDEEYSEYVRNLKDRSKNG